MGTDTVDIKDQLILNNATAMMGSETELLLDYNKIVGIGGEAVVLDLDGDNVIKVVEIHDAQGQSQHPTKEYEGKTKKGEIHSVKVESSFVLKPQNFMVQVIDIRTFYLFGKYHPLECVYF